MFALCCVSVASAGSVTQDDYYFSGTESTITLGTDALNKLASGGESFTISYELEGLTFNDLVENPRVFFELDLTAVDGSTLEVSMGCNQTFGFYAVTSSGGMQVGNSVSYIPESVPFGTVSEVQTWTGEVTADTIAESKLVPEPTTAALSLLALAGLAARRRIC